MNNFDVLLGMKLGGGGGSSTLVSKTITANGTYNPSDDNADGYSVVVANVPNTYTLADEGKVVDSGALVSQTAKNIDANGLYDTTLNNSVSVDVPNTYTAGDEGKVVSDGALIAQTAYPSTVTTNGTYNTTLNNSVVVAVPNTYTASDNGKVVSNQQLVSQTAKPDTITVNDTYNTTEYNSVTVNVPNSYTAGDEGKVVDNGALVSQTAYPSTIVTNGTYDTTLNNSVTVDVPSAVIKKDVNFYDYDGTLLYSYTAQEFLQLSELPANPTHSGLTAQGWNWTLADAKSYVEQFTFNSIGQCYVTSDGKTRFYINIPTDNCPIRIYTAAVDIYDAVIDWGDGTTDNITTTTTDHSYAMSGNYVITITVNDGCILTLGNGTYPVLMDSRYLNTAYPEAYNTYLIKAEIGVNVVFSSTFKYCSKLESVNIPNTISAFGDYFFTNCHTLQCIIIPNGVTRLPSYFAQNCDHLVCISLSPTITTLSERAINANGECDLCLPPNVSSFGEYSVSFGVFDNIVLASGTVSASVVSTLIGRYTTIVNTTVLPNFGYITGGSYGEHIKMTNNVTYILSNALADKRYDEIIIPDSVTTCSSTISDSPYVTKLTIGSGLSTLPRIGGGYYGGRSLVNLKQLIFRRTTPPTCSNASNFLIPTGCVIYVPTGTLTAYTTAANYPDPNIYTYVEY